MRNFRPLVLGLVLVSLAGVSWGDCVEGDCFNGKGKYTLANGSVYEGDFIYGNFNGKGKITWASGNVYEGDWKADQRTGKGKFTQADGSVYEGDFLNGQRTGKGKATWASGDVYEGDWKADQKTGRGKYTWANGLVARGVFQDGEYLGTIAEEERNQRIFNACLLDKSFGLNMQVKSIEAAVKARCEAIADDPSWLESLQYD